MGKTTLLFRFLEQIRPTSRTVLLFDIDPEFKPRDLAAYVLRDLGLKVPDSALEVHDLLKEVLVAEAKANRKFVLVIDEAQNLSEAALEMVRLMSNFETSQTKLMQIVLAGQPQLAETLRKPSLLQFRQRISYFCRIEPLSKQETKAYIAERLKYADYKGKALFSDKALDLIADAFRKSGFRLDASMLDKAGFEFAFYRCVRLCQRFLDIPSQHTPASEHVVRAMRMDERTTWRESFIDCP